MKMLRFVRCICLLLLLGSAALLLVGCGHKVPEGHFALVEDDRLLYRLIIPKKQSDMMASAVSSLQNALQQEGIAVEAPTWLGDDTGAQKEIHIGKTMQFSESMLQGVDLERLGVDGFVIKVCENRIIIAAQGDEALAEAVAYFSANFLNVKEDKIYMPNEYFHIESKGLFLSSLTLAGKSVSVYALTADAGLEVPRGYLQTLITDKCAVSLTETGEHKIHLTTVGAQDGLISATFENGDLVIRAKDEAAMKKAVVCFFYENIGNAVGSCALAADLAYTRDLTKTVFYSDFNVTQSDNVCCLDELIAAHTYANEHGYKVFADYGATYYVSSTGKTARIKTDVEWGNAKFTVDDSSVSAAEKGNWIFTLTASTGSYNIDADTVQTITRGMTNVGFTLPQKSMVTFYDNTKKQYIRYGANADSGAIKCDTVIVYPDGTIDSATPLMWDFDHITEIKVTPIDATRIAVGGGHFTTIANQAPIACTYYSRGIQILRSNVTVYNIQHSIVGEGTSGAPYSGFFFFSNCADVLMENCVMSGHRYYYDSSAKVYYGTYDLGLGNAFSITMKNCTQFNSITDNSFWGIMGANYCKNITYDSCALSRFDAHKGVANATIKNSIIGHSGASITGYGTLLIEDSVFHADFMIGLREDYGSTWEGDIVIVNSAIVPTSAKNVVTVITGSNNCQHDFGYDCYMPKNVKIDGLTVYSTKAKVYVLGNMIRDCVDSSFTPTYAFYVTKSVAVKNIKTLAGSADVVLSSNEFLYAATAFTKE